MSGNITNRKKKLKQIIVFSIFNKFSLFKNLVHFLEDTNYTRDTFAFLLSMHEFYC